MVGDSALAAQDYLGWVAEARDLALGDTVDLLFIGTSHQHENTDFVHIFFFDTSHHYDDTVRELQAWAPLMSGLVCVCVREREVLNKRIV